MSEVSTKEQIDSPKIFIAAFIAIFILIVSVYISYKSSQKLAGSIILPAGNTYLGPTPTPTLSPSGLSQRSMKFTAPSDTIWKKYKSKFNPLTFSYPATLVLINFIEDPTDSVGIVWEKIPPQENILLNLELIALRDKTLLTQPKIDYVRNWYKFFSGLKGLASVTPFTNTSGLKGFRASFLNLANEAPNTDIFLEIPGKSDTLIHLANGVLEPQIFDRIVDSVNWGTK